MTQCINYYNYSNILNILSYIACSFYGNDAIYLNYEYEKYNNNFINNNFINNNFINDNFINNNFINNNFININNKLDLLVINYPNIYYFCLTYSLIILSDKILVILFGVNARWFQLHSLINFFITIHIFKDYLKIIIDPANGYLVLNQHYASYLILNLHLFHLITFKNLGFYDYFHHILFVAFGVLPTIIFIKTNQCYLAYIPCSGIPGTIEYFILSLYKHNKISLVTQKYLNSINYNYFRYPLCIIGATYNFINYNNGNLLDNFYITIYTNILLFLNGSLFNHLTLESYFEKKLKKIK
jgi:hypothetical protein